MGKKKKTNFYKILVIFLTMVSITFILLYISSLRKIDYPEQQENSSEIPLTMEYCTQLGLKAGDDLWNCQVRTAENIYGIEFDSSLTKSKYARCYFWKGDYCIGNETAYEYYNSVYESCRKNFPSSEDVFAECISKI